LPAGTQDRKMNSSPCSSFHVGVIILVLIPKGQS
jgi:hypothetical protein